MSGVYRIRLMFEWGGGTLWCGNETASKKFDVGPVEELLPISDLSRDKLNSLSQLHDTALNWEYPPDPGPWSKDEYASFEKKALALSVELQAELGSEFEVVYESLGCL